MNIRENGPLKMSKTWPFQYMCATSVYRVKGTLQNEVETDTLDVNFVVQAFIYLILSLMPNFFVFIVD